MKDNRAAKGFPRRPHPRKPRPGALLWPEDLLGRCARVTAIGSQRVLVENHTGILAFTESKVLLGSHAGVLCVTGRNLSLSGIRPGALIIHGDINCVKLPCDGGDAPDEG